MVHANRFAIAVVFAVLPAVGARAETPARVDSCSAALPSGFALGAEKSFVSELEESTCRSLRFDDEHVAWVERYGAAPRSVYFLGCDEAPNVGGLPLKAGAVYGEVSQELHRVTASARHVERATLEPPPGWNLLSNPTFCGARVAYLAGEAGGAVATVYDLEARAVVARQPINEPVPDSDYRHHFPQPVWSESGRSVRFWSARSEAQPITLDLP